MKRFMHVVLGALLGIAVVSCGGGGSTVAEGGIGGTGISSGSVSAFGSIVVNGRHFDVDAAEITVNGDPNATEANLDVGYVVRVDGDLQDGVADSVRFDADLIGEVDDNQIPATGDPVGTLIVMQQAVEITPTTVIAGGTSPEDIRDQVNDLAPDHVLVSGFRDSGGVLVAAHLEVLAGVPPTDQVVGRVTDSKFAEFAIGGLTVNSSAQPEPGDRVLVRGDYDPGTPEFTPTEPVVTVEDLALTGAEIELEGIVSEFNGRSDFRVDGVRVNAGGPGVEIVDETGAPAAGQLANDVEVEVEGTFNSAGVLVADRVEIELEDNVEIVAQVAAVDATAGMETVSFFDPGTGPLVVAAVTAKTRLRDKSTAEIENFSLADLAPDEWVEIDAFEDGSGNVTALKIERIDVETEVQLEGTIGAPPDTNTVTILGVDLQPVDPDDLVGLQAGDIAEATWQAAEMFMQPMPVDSVEKED